MSALADYYAAQANEANAKVPLTALQTRLANAQLDQVAPDAASKRALEAAQAGLAGANANALTAKLPSDIALDTAKTNDLNSQANQQNTASSALRLKLPSEILASQASAGLDTARSTALGLTTPSDLSTAALQRQQVQQSLQQFTPEQFAKLVAAAGLGKEKGGIAGRKKDDAKPGKTDTIPTMLAPGEAVLNKHAVDHYGVDVIDHMNKMGMLRGKAHDEVHKAHAKKHGKKAA